MVLPIVSSLNCLGCMGLFAPACARSMPTAALHTMTLRLLKVQPSRIHSGKKNKIQQCI